MHDTVHYNALALRPHGSGVATYIREIVRAVSALTDVALVAHVLADAVDELPERVTAITRPVSSGARRAVAGLALRPGTGLLHALDIDVPLRRPAGPTVATVHDLSVFDVPWTFTGVRSRGERVLISRAMRRADALVAVSAFTAERVEARFGRTCTVTPLAPSPEMTVADEDEVDRVRERYGVTDRSVVHVGNIEPRKRIDLLARACERAGLPLLLAGSVLPGAEVPASARRLGYVPGADLPGLYGAAGAVAYPSCYEGFGLPPVEAMACGAAVVATRVGGLPEVVGPDGGGALLVPVDDEDALLEALREATGDADRNAALRVAGREAAGRLSWSQTAQDTLAVYRGLGVAC